ncbi:SLBB domain-containing protein [Mucilaginibacter auburnensis]|uniref:Protein involved in polysaccharide export with SLBB domain n=1 Tax=Mucilaginibacter auburnensis TaxID=1457233 RepID=A0A2H9VTB8_9SPHI|nr:SLBB domain-containing protein [Mucilaginibacter auburnensis]PJJ84073.1 protein involved in polysaccharide export with SLBB domain [Mucilaginibacter auburnensis]
MRNIYLFLIILFTFSFLSTDTFAQISSDKIKNAKVSQASDEQITALWNQAKDRGLSESQIYAFLIQQGMPEGEVEELKNRVTLLGLNSKPKTTSTSAPAKVENKDKVGAENKTASNPPPVKKITPKEVIKEVKTLPIYGLDLFKQTSLTFEPNASAPTPKNYILGPGDVVIVLLTGLNEKLTQSTITPEGKLLIEHVGSVQLSGFTIEQATSVIKNAMAKTYPAIAAGRTKLTVNLGTTRRIKVMVTGEVNTPGSYTISALSTLFNVLYSAGGPNQNGSLRYIRLIRNNKVIKTADFYDFLQNGLATDNVRIEDQDVISIPVYKKRVGISGAVKREALFELKDNETLADLIKYAGGFTPNAYQGMARLTQVSDLQKDVKDVTANTFANYIPRNGDMVAIDVVADRYSNRIVLEGAVYQPGPYELTAGLTLSQLLKKAQGLKPEAYMERGYIKRTMPDLQKTAISFDPRQIIEGKNDFPLMREDSVVILGQNLFVSNQKITVNGYVRNPTEIEYRKGLKLVDAIAIAGGFDDQAASHHVEVSRVIKNNADSVATQVVTTYMVNMDDPTDPNREIALEPRDVISVRGLVNYRELGSVKIRGEVAFPGDYPIRERNEVAQEFLTRAGGLTPYGSLENVQIYRNGVRVNVNLLSTKTKNVLLPGDSVFVPRVISYVEVAGAVNNPQFIAYKGRNFKYYINSAAGATENARLKGAYIKYPDGLNKPVRHVLFFRSYPPVKPGSKIVVPEKNPEIKFKLGAGEIGGVAAILSALVSMVAVLSRK